MCRYIELFGHTIPTYGLCFIFAIFLPTFLAVWRLKRLHGNVDNMITIAASTIAGAIFGARVLYALATYGLTGVYERIMALDFSFFQGSGMVFYGGLIGGIGCAILCMKIVHETQYNLLATAITPCIPFGHAIGRVGCMLAGCCYGLPYEGVGALHLIDAGIEYPVFPIQALEAGLNILLGIVLLLYTKNRKPTIKVIYAYLMCYSIIRFILEFFRGDAVRGIYAGISTSQWISLLLFVISVWAMMRTKKQRINADKSEG